MIIYKFFQLNKKAKKVTINLINKNDNKCFQYTTKLALNHEEIGVHSEGITTTNPFIDKYNWEEINYLSENHDWKKLEKNNLTIVLNGKHILPTFQKIHKRMKHKLFF